MDRVSAGIDIGGGSTKIGLLSAKGAILEQDSIPNPDSRSGKVVIDAFLDGVSALVQNSQTCRLVSVGIGVPGHVISDNTSTELCNVSALNRFPIAKHASNRLKVPVTIQNDATYAALGEYLHGGGKGSDRFLMVTLGTGMGVAFVDCGNIVTTANGTIGDAGHMILDYEMRYACRKGCRGCLESVASGVALERDAKAIAMSYPESYLGKILSQFSRDPTVKDIVDGSQSDDPQCVAILDEAARWVGIWVCSLIHIFGPDRLAFGGGWSAAGKEFIESVHGYAIAGGLGYYFEELDFVAAELGNSAGIIGAASHAFASAVR